MIKVQLFSFFPNKIEASEITEKIDPEDAETWDFLLIEDNRVVTAYRSMEKRGGKGAMYWNTIERGKNPWKLEFMSPGDHSYNEENYSKFRKYAV